MKKALENNNVTKIYSLEMKLNEKDMVIEDMKKEIE